MGHLLSRSPVIPPPARQMGISETATCTRFDRACQILPRLSETSSLTRILSRGLARAGLRRKAAVSSQLVPIYCAFPQEQYACDDRDDRC